MEFGSRCHRGRPDATRLLVVINLAVSRIWNGDRVAFISRHALPPGRSRVGELEADGAFAVLASPLTGKVRSDIACRYGGARAHVHDVVAGCEHHPARLVGCLKAMAHFVQLELKSALQNILILLLSAIGRGIINAEDEISRAIYLRFWL